MELVVARYKEHVDWVDRFPNALIYNKGTLLADCKASQELLPNMGRESQTYLHHICTRYDALADVTLFTQGWPFDHCYEEDLLHASETLRFRGLSKEQLTETFDAPEFHPGLEQALHRVWRTLFSGPPPAYITFGPGAIFSVTSNQIRARPKRFYEMAHYLAWEHPDVGYALERLWPVIFSQQPSHIT